MSTQPFAQSVPYAAGRHAEASHSHSIFNLPDSTSDFSSSSPDRYEAAETIREGTYVDSDSLVS